MLLSSLSIWLLVEIYLRNSSIAVVRIINERWGEEGEEVDNQFCSKYLRKV